MMTKNKTVRPRKHGRSRPGSGRPRLAGVGVTKIAVGLLDSQIAKVERWREVNGAENFSDALRQMIDATPAP